MGLFNNLMKKLFGGNQQKAESVTEPVNNYMERWEHERKERISSAETKLKDWLALYVKENRNLEFSWESGNDEGFVTFQDSASIGEDRLDQMESYIIDKLDIPAAGEFQMNGSGFIYLDNNLIKVKYSSIMKALVDFDEKTEEEIYSEEEHDSGDVVLFAI